jgi:L-arabinose transport system substrate-binding protein
MKRLVLIYCTIIGALFVSLLTIAEADSVKIGFVVKLPEEPWFQDEWRFAEQAAKEKNFTLVKIGAENGEKVMSAIDNLASQQAQDSSSACLTSN